MDAQNNASAKSRKQLRRVVLRTMEARAKNAEGTEHVPLQHTDSTLEVVKEPSLLQEIFEVFMLEAPIITLIMVLMIIVGYFEGWTVFDSVYYAVITGTTVGFGDFSPHHKGVRLACCFLLPLCVCVLCEFLGRVASVYMSRHTRKCERDFLNRAMTMADLDAMDTDRDGRVQPGEFLSFMLVALQKVDKADIDEIMELFHELDVTRTGAVNPTDIYSQSPDSIRRATVKMNASGRNSSRSSVMSRHETK